MTVWCRPNGLPIAIDPVARLHLVGVAELDLLQRLFGLLGQLDQRAVGERVAADDLGRVLLGVRSAPYRRHSISVAPSTTWLLVRMKPALPMMKPVPGPFRDHLVVARFGLLAPWAGAPLPAEEPLEQVVSLAAEELASAPACAAADSVRMLTTAGVCALAMFRKVGRVDRAGERRAVRRRHR